MRRSHVLDKGVDLVGGKSVFNGTTQDCFIVISNRRHGLSRIFLPFKLKRPFRGIVCGDYLSV